MPGSKKVVPAMIDTTEKDLPLCWWTARDLAKAIRNREASAVEVMRAHLDRISDVNDKVNVIVSMVSAHEALAAAEAADRAVARGDDLGPLHGLPTAVKDLVDVRGFPTTRGSSAYADAPPATRDSLLARRLREAGAIIIGKTNTPEHGVGTLTFNSVFGITRNPYDLSRHAGGSSSAAAALAAGMLPVADGSDSGGSLRYPSAFCNTVGLRTSAGRVPAGAEGSGWSPHGVLGPMARNSQDAGLILSAIAGSDENSPLSLTEDPAVFADIQPSELAGLRIAWSQDADGLPIDLEVRAAHNKARDTLASLGCVIDDLEPDFTDADECWEIIEMFGFFSIGREGVASHPEFFRADFIRNVRQGEALSATEIDRGLRLRADLFRRTARLMENYDLLVLPATPVVAPPAEVEWVTQVDGTVFDRYFYWQRMANRVTVTAHPALVTSGGFTETGLPVGLQLLGRFRGEFDLLKRAAAIEEATGWVNRRPARI